eukprot:4007809-Pleurochrysis_carterae.AAC.4
MAHTTRDWPLRRRRRETLPWRPNERSVPGGSIRKVYHSDDEAHGRQFAAEKERHLEDVMSKQKPKKQELCQGRRKKKQRAKTKKCFVKARQSCKKRLNASSME